MRILPEFLKLAGALVIAGILRHPETFPPPGAGFYFFLGTFAWPLLFVPLLLWHRQGTISTILRVLEVSLLGWTTFMVWFAAGMDPGKGTFALVLGVVVYAIGAAWSDLLAWRASRRASSDPSRA
jgi:hypothetical protein